ncbi:hypothetical protein E4582_07635 [Luteimonas yindakuii]|uniref:DUF3303 domain-containing protein n=1 Tax=Luteimonas yindakuii TaxID=2565782 RepID=A0A4Z1RCV4_9GAMM|nr:hypothetical protein [Luteimonas yindakuii]TKS54638.1 hypothetical protein E4582_07635 [Luteimonas yindakuii]
MRLASAACMVLAALCCHGIPASAQERTSMAETRVPTAQRWQRFIVKYHAHTDAGQDADAVRPRLERVAKDAGLQRQGMRPALRWERRLGVGADLVIADPPLDHDTAQRLLRLFADDPDVEYAEPDGMMQRGPGPEPAGPVTRGD